MVPTGDLFSEGDHGRFLLAYAALVWRHDNDSAATLDTAGLRSA